METIRIPIYPGADVVFPGQLYPISIKSTGARQMVRFCRELRYPLGVVFAPPTSGSNLARIGTLAYLMEPKSRATTVSSNVLVVGQTRFRIQQLHYDRAYLEATVQAWPWIQEPRPEWYLVEQLGGYLHRYIAALSDILPPTLLPEMLISHTATLGVLGAALLQIPPQQKQSLLSMPTSRALLIAVLRYMRVYVPIAERLATMEPERQQAYERIFFN